MTEPARSAKPPAEPAPSRYTTELAARKKALEIVIASETELYRERMEAYERQLEEIERQAMKQA